MDEPRAPPGEVVMRDDEAGRGRVRHLPPERVPYPTGSDSRGRRADLVYRPQCPAAGRAMQLE